MEYKYIQEMFLALGVAGAIIVVFLSVFIYMIKKNYDNYQKLHIMNDKLSENDARFEVYISELSKATKSIADVAKELLKLVEKVDYYNKNLNKNQDKNNDQNEKIFLKIIDVDRKIDNLMSKLQRGE